MQIDTGWCLSKSPPEFHSGVNSRLSIKRSLFEYLGRDDLNRWLECRSMKLPISISNTKAYLTRCVYGVQLSVYTTPSSLKHQLHCVIRGSSPRPMLVGTDTPGMLLSSFLRTWLIGISNGKQGMIRVPLRLESSSSPALQKQTLKSMTHPHHSLPTWTPSLWETLENERCWMEVKKSW